MKKHIFKKALFLDRDGVINEDFGYVYARENFIFKKGIFKALRGFSKAGYVIVVITNQSGIGRGYYTRQQFLDLSEFMCAKFKTQGINIAKIKFCPHSPEQNCQCRKPSGEMIKQAADELDIELDKSIMIGDKQSDVLAGQNAGVGRNFLLTKGQKSVLEIFKILEDKKEL